MNNISGAGVEETLAGLQRRLNTAEAEHERLSREIPQLRKAVDALTALVDPQLVNAGPTPNGAVASASSGSATDLHPRVVVAERPSATIDRVTAIVEESRVPLKFSDIYKAMQERGWIDPNWKTPEATVSAAARRAANTGLIEVDGRLYSSRTNKQATVGDNDGEEDTVEEVMTDE